MALEDLTGVDKFPDDLVITNPVGSTDPKSEGDDHIRGVKNVIVNTLPNITGAITPTQTELNILAGQEGALLLVGYAAGAGTADAITADFTPNVSLTDGVTVLVEAVGAITVTNPTFAPDGLAAKTIRTGSDEALILDNIKGNSQRLLLSYHAAQDIWLLLNPRMPDNPILLDTPEEIINTSTATGAWTTVNNTTLNNAKARQAILKCVTYCTQTAATGVSTAMYIRRTGSGLTNNSVTREARSIVIGNATETHQQDSINVMEVNLDSSYDFDYYTELSGSPLSHSFVLYLTGYKI